jgi:hypothetical protein
MLLRKGSTFHFIVYEAVPYLKQNRLCYNIFFLFLFEGPSRGKLNLDKHDSNDVWQNKK